MKTQPWHKLSDDKAEALTGWICPEGLFYPCESQGNNDLMDESLELGYETSYECLEDNLIRFREE